MTLFYRKKRFNGIAFGDRLIFLPVIGMIICSVIRSEYEKGGKI